MRITLLAPGSRGDVQPMVALGQGLQRHHQVVLAAPGSYRPLVEEHGLEFRELAGDPQQTLNSEEGQEWVRASNPLTTLSRMRRLIEPLAEAFLESSLAAAADADALISSPLAPTGQLIAEAHGLPELVAMLQPLLPTAAYPGLEMPRLPLGRLYNRLSWLPLEQGTSAVFGSFVRGWRRTLGLPALPRWRQVGMIRTYSQPVLLGFSEFVVPRPRDLSINVYQTGYWFLEPASEWRPPEPLTDFLAGERPVAVIAYGSLSITAQVEQLIAMTVEAVISAGLRALVIGGPRIGGRGILQVASVPHDWAFSRAAVIFHHGGAGTTAAALRAGRPAVIVPQFTDQPFWAERVVSLGAGVRVSRGQATPALLELALRDARASSHAAAARRVAARLATEHGVDTAVAHIERHINSSSSSAVSPATRGR